MNERRRLDAAYRAADYAVDLPGGRCSLRVGRFSSELAALYLQHGLSEAAYLTAWNPGSQAQPPTVNAAANAALQRQLEGGGKPCYAGHAIDPEGKWPAEGSFLVLGMPMREAAALGRQCGQFAILVADARAIPELLWLLEFPD